MVNMTTCTVIITAIIIIIIDNNIIITILYYCGAQCGIRSGRWGAEARNRYYDITANYIISIVTAIIITIAYSYLGR